MQKTKKTQYEIFQKIVNLSLYQKRHLKMRSVSIFSSLGIYIKETNCPLSARVELCV